MTIRVTYIKSSNIDNYVYCKFSDHITQSTCTIFVFCWLVKTKVYNEMLSRSGKNIIAHYFGKDMIAHFVPETLMNNLINCDDLKSDLVPNLKLNPKETILAVNKHIISLIADHYPHLKVVRTIDRYLKD